MQRAYYSAKIKSFLDEQPEVLLGKLKYLKNAYRVLMTRARQGVVIFIPEGVDPEVDSSRSHFYYDDIYKYLRSCGIIELE